MNEKYLLSNNLLTQHISAINKCVEAAKKNIFEICIRLSILADSDLDNETNGEYTNIVDFSAHYFGFARSTTLNYIKIAREYLVTDYIEQGENKKPKTVFHTRCIETTEDGETIDYKIGQLNALGKTTSDDFETMHSEGVISPDMSADAIKKAVKAWYAPEEDEPEEQEEEDDRTEEETEQDSYTTGQIIDALDHILEKRVFVEGEKQRVTIEMYPENFSKIIVAAIKALGG